VDAACWDAVGSSYEDTIFGSFSKDRFGVILDRLDQYADTASVATDALASGIPPAGRSANELLQSLVRIEGVPTKHYLCEEATVFLENGGFRVASVDKVECRWDTEFEDPPAWMGRPGPWDWLLIAKRV
jgi:hypothetical protein